jgi:hypothetical protein
MMPGAGDDEASGAKKIITLLGNTLNNQKNQIQSLRSRYGVTDLQDQYTTTYNKYLPLVQKFGTEAQMKNPALAPDELFGGPEVQKKLIASGPAPILPASTRVGTSASTDAALTAGTMPQYMVGRTPQLPSDDVWSKAAATAAGAPVEEPDLTGRIPQLPAAGAWQTPTTVQGGATQEQLQERAQKQAAALPILSKAAYQSAVEQPLRSAQMAGQAIGSGIHWLWSLPDILAGPAEENLRRQQQQQQNP